MKKLSILFLILSSISFLHAETMSNTSFEKNNKNKNKKKVAKDVTSSQTQTVHSQASAVAHNGATTNSFTHELVTSFSNGGFTSQKPCSNCDSVTDFGASVSYLHFLKDNIQIGGEFGLSNNNKYGSSNTFIDLAGVASYNFQEDLSNSFYSKVGLGFFTLRKITNDTEMKIGFFAGAGKRFQWLPNINYSPEFRIFKKGSLDPEFDLYLLNFGIHWN